jgi:threonine/homoserine/homoserine lactone efflux protein
LGAAFADAFYGCVAGFGLVSISGFLISHKLVIHLVGGSFLLYLGVKTFLSPSKTKLITDNAKTLLRDFTSTFLLTLTNPATIISFVAIYASLGIVDTTANYNDAMLIIAGVFLGSLFWWMILSLGISAVKHKLSDKTVYWINGFSGVVLCGFGLFAIISVFLK